MLFFRTLIITFVFSCCFAGAENLYVFGPFDFNKNGKSEILKLNGLLAPLELVELDDSSRHKTLWSFKPPASVQIVDAKFSDLNQDGVPELVIALRDETSSSWLSVLEWNGAEFTPLGGAVKNGGARDDKVRPSNLAVYSNVFAAAMSSPARSASIFSLSMDEGVASKLNTQRYTAPLVTNGYGPVYVGLFTISGDSYAGLISPEGDVLKTSIFSLSNPDQVLYSDILVTSGARVVLGPDIQPFDENKDGSQELLVPFATGEVYALGLKDSALSFAESRLSRSGLFGMKSGAGEVEINNVVLSRIESGLYEPPLWIPETSLNDSLLLLVSDTLTLGDTLDWFLLPDSTSTFFHFNWESTPPSGMRFNPSTYSIMWAPTREHLGAVDVSYALTIREKEKLISGVDSLGDTHHIHPILQSLDSSFVILIGDTIKPPEPFVLIPDKHHRVYITSVDIDEGDRFTFAGETPFGTTSRNINDVITVGVSANLNTIKQNKSSAFNFQSSEAKPDSIITLSLVHDLSSNIFYATLHPSLDSIAQSFDPEGWKSDLYPYPEYFFEGFSDKMALDSISGGGLSLLSSEGDMSGSIYISSPLRSQDHGMTISYFGGRPHAIRGDVSVKADGSHKTLTEIDFSASLVPLNISTVLTPVSRDTFIFHADSLPDTLKAKINYRSFYVPAKILENVTPESVDTSLAPISTSVPADSTQ